MASHNEPQYEVVVIGAGAGGICAGIKLQEQGIDNILLVDRDHDFGGTWLANTYPNVGADLPFLVYQFSFAPKPDWDRFFAKGAQIQEYHVSLALQAGLDKKVRFNTNIVKEEWDEENHRWLLHVEGGEIITARFVLSAIGAYINPKDKPDIPGLDEFEGKTMIPARWDHDYDFTGKRAAIIGVGSSAVQIAPALAEQVSSLDIYQRTTQWYFPKPDFKTPRWLTSLLKIPGVAGLTNRAILACVDVGLAVLIHTPDAVFQPAAKIFDIGALQLYKLWLRMTVRSKENRKKLTPKFGAGCTRGTLGGGYLSVFNRSNVQLHTTSIQRITKNAVVTSDGVEHPIDALVLATGYEMFSDPETYREGTVIGHNGFDLGKFYNTVGLRTYHSTAVAGLPNRWVLVGPYSWTGNAFHSILEIAMSHIGAALGEARTRKATRMEVRQEAQDWFQAEMVKNGRNLHHYFSVRCAGSNTYFVNSQGEAIYVRPWTVTSSRKNSVGFPREDYTFATLPARRPAADAKAAVPVEAAAVPVPAEEG
ncbi:flavin-containing monooxygenase [Segniliparus rugosus]|uniref:Monooxygenase n=1 Tax=Segniliparus rugosus (strain ATCC BAA-974 / DSM 45345 / CCUG 50838 / CIP 108380 / JCM 13579 / CDC 945) TaxID=679197 RepID=E5XR23_SEGRC|nr:NAD(P)/FAD-dependent oxidoreductase [Segniliparus rugosus]EFV13216.1 hypothetical protein HMPREF9336_01945 [Segniliparus rugosus ATCC BAA-974]